VKWNAAVNATGYTVSWGTTSAATGGNVVTSTTTATVTGLKPNTLYYLRVQASPVKAGAGFASLTKTTAKSTTGGGGSTGGATHPVDKTPYKHVVTKDGESFSSIAAQYHYKPGGHALWVYNYTSSPHTADARATIKKRGANLIVHGETIYVPRS